MKKFFILIFFLLVPLFLFAVNNFSGTFNESFINLWTNQKETSFINKLSLDSSIHTDNSFLNFSADYFYGFSNLEKINGDVQDFSFSTEVGTSDFSLQFGINNFSSQNFSFHFNKALFLQNNLNGTSQVFGLKINLPIKINPFLVVNSISSENGSFYFFNGRVDSPSFLFAGSFFEYENHSLQIYYSNPKISIFTNENDFQLGNFNSNLYGIFYSYDYSFGNWNFSSGVGFNKIEENFDVLLTSINQKYAFFPYINIDLNFTGAGDLLVFSQNSCWSKNNSSIDIDIFGITFLNSGILEKRNWKYKKAFIFDGSEGYSKIDHRILNHSLLLLPQIKYSYRRQKNSKTVDFSVSKLFEIPVNFNNYKKSVIENSANPDDPYYIDFDLFISTNKEELLQNLKWYFLSGIKFEFSYSY